MKALTVEQLALFCAKAKARGFGNRKILISGDDEGNSYHELFFEFTKITDDFCKPFMASTLPYGVTAEEAIEEYIILG